MSAISGSGTSSGTSGTNAYSALTSGDFMSIIFTELSRQDPLAPNDTKALLEQISLIRSIESDISLTDRVGDLVRQSEITSASAVIAKFVTGLTENGQNVAGYVDSVSVTEDGTVLNLSSGFRVPLSRVTEIIDPELLDGVVTPTGNGDQDDDPADPVDETNDDPVDEPVDDPTDEPDDTTGDDTPGGSAG